MAAALGKRPNEICPVYDLLNLDKVEILPFPTSIFSFSKFEEFLETPLNLSSLISILYWNAEFINIDTFDIW